MLPTPQKNQVSEFQKNQPVMQQVNKQRSKAERMDPIEILEYSADGDKELATRTYNKLTQLVNNDPNFRIMRANNSLFIYNNLKNGSISLALETADSPRVFIDSLKQFRLAMKVAGFKTAIFEIDNPQIIKAAKLAGIDLKIEPSGTMLDDGVTPGLIGIGEF